MIITIVLKRLCYSKFASLRFKRIAMQLIDELYQFIYNHKTRPFSLYESRLNNNYF